MPARSRPRGRTLPRWGTLALALAALGGGVLLWRTFMSGPQLDVGPEDVASDPVSPAAPPRPGLSSDRLLPETAPPPREGIYDPAERFPSPGSDFRPPRLHIPSMSDADPVGGDRIREALLAVPGLYLRWDSTEVKDAFLRAELQLPAGVATDATEEVPAGLPLKFALQLLAPSGYRAQVRLPMVRILRLERSGSGRLPPR